MRRNRLPQGASARPIGKKKGRCSRPFGPAYSSWLGLLAAYSEAEAGEAKPEERQGARLRRNPFLRVEVAVGERAVHQSGAAGDGRTDRKLHATIRDEAFVGAA